MPSDAHQPQPRSPLDVDCPDHGADIGQWCAGPEWVCVERTLRIQRAEQVLASTRGRPS